MAAILAPIAEALGPELLSFGESMLPTLMMPSSSDKTSSDSQPSAETKALAKAQAMQIAASQPKSSKKSIFGVNTYRFTGYFITLFILLIILFILLDKVTYYEKIDNEELPLNIRLSYKIFVAYIIVIFCLLFQFYILNDNYSVIYSQISIIDEILEIFNVLAIIFITYFIYRQIENINNPCPLPNKKVCEVPDCKGSYECKKYKSFSTCSKDEYNNSHMTVDNTGSFKPGKCPSFNKFVSDNFDFRPPLSPTLPPSTPETPQKIIPQTGDFNKKYDELELEIQSLRDKINDLSKEDKLKNEVDIPSENKEANISCANDGVCPPSSIGCNDQGMCEGFELISFEEKLQLLNSENNFDEACDLMDQLKKFILSTFTN